MSDDLLALAKAALEDEKRGTQGEWVAQIGNVGVMCKPRRGSDAPTLSVHAAGLSPDDAVVIAAARTREPLLARGYLDAVAELARLKALREHECTCPLGDARESITKHAKDCALRVNRLKRIPPGVALDRLARALDHGKENDELCALLLEACDLADEANGDPSSCSHNVMIGERVAELRVRTGDAPDLVAQRDAAIAQRDAARADLDRWRNQFVCVQCEALHTGVDEDGCCTTCGMDCLVIVDGKLTGGDSVMDCIADADCESSRDEIGEAMRERDTHKLNLDIALDCAKEIGEERDAAIARAERLAGAVESLQGQRETLRSEVAELRRALALRPGGEK